MIFAGVFVFVNYSSSISFFIVSGTSCSWVWQLSVVVPFCSCSHVWLCRCSIFLLFSCVALSLFHFPLVLMCGSVVVPFCSCSYVWLCCSILLCSHVWLCRCSILLLFSCVVLCRCSILLCSHVWLCRCSVLLLFSCVALSLFRFALVLMCGSVVVPFCSCSHVWLCRCSVLLLFSCVALSLFHFALVLMCKGIFCCCSS